MHIIRTSRVLYRLLLPLVFGALVFKLSVWCGAEGYVYGLRAAAEAPKPSGFSRAKHPQPAFLRRGSKAVGPTS